MKQIISGIHQYYISYIATTSVSLRNFNIVDRKLSNGLLKVTRVNVKSYAQSQIFNQVSVLLQIQINSEAKLRGISIKT